MDILEISLQARLGVALLVCLLGFFAALTGVLMMRAGEYQTSLKRLAVQSTQISQKAIGDVEVAPVLQATAQLVGAVNELIRTAVGVGAFLCLGGTLLILVGYGLIPHA